MNEPNLPDEIKKLKQWCLTMLIEDGDKTRKMPVSAVQGCKVSPTDSATWSYYNDIVERLNDRYLPCFATGNGFCVIDLDGCIDENGEFSELAENICGAFADTYIEKSVSGHGLHVVCKCTELLPNSKTKKIELYTHDHFITLTGKGNDKPVVDMTNKLVTLSEWLDKPKKEQEKKRQQMREQNKNFSVPYETKLSDEEIVEKAARSRGGAKFKALYAGEWENLGLGDGSQSCADIALMATLAFWSGCDEAQMERMFRSSGLYRNDRKLKLALRAAVNGCTATYKGGRRT